MYQCEEKNKRPYFFVKRLLDVVFSGVLIIFLSLPMLIIWVAVRLDSCGLPIFKQTRIGRGGKKFLCYKFRTMRADAPECPTKDFKNMSAYVTRTGRFLRRSSLDELPQLINVLKGDMSLVGPRPLICGEQDVHRMRMQRGVYSIRPGITGLSQICGRDELSDEKKVELDRAYLDGLGLWQDIRILGKTINKVLDGEGIAGTGSL